MNSTQQSWIAVRLITTFGFTVGAGGVAAGVDGVFLEVHEEPSRAKSDAQNALQLDLLEPLLRRLMAIDAITKAAERTGSAARVASAHG